jgi:P2 family phage contractile tail tube protein
MLVPNQVNNFNAFLNGNKNLGVADATLPDITMEADDLKGAGLAGTLNIPVIGQTSDLTTTINFHDQTSDTFGYLWQVGQQVTLMGALQQYDSSTGDLLIVPLRVVMQTLPKKYTMGKFEPGTKSGMSVELSITAFGVWYNNVQTVNIDKINMIFEVNGVDYLAAVRTAIGF